MAAAVREAAFLHLGGSLRLRTIIGCPTLVVGGPEGELGIGNRSVWDYLRDPLRTTFHGGCNVIAARDVDRGLAVLATDGLHRE
ncbi:hypothetical protein GCM10010178_88460 [Lentzea flava]|uniref:ROK family protein n=1 Tax=Lentzea flava TaxID=103732 RepID=A0ABQ2VFV9_9PSEU|nr:hypothetical protein [Lentzea flava]GGU84480.1 hypothetical protein GCM10010178_88460 [Lentzea flava]